MSLLNKDNLSSTFLTACVLGLLSSPYIFVAIGALFKFNLIAILLLVTLLLLASGFLFWRYLSKPLERKTNIYFIVLEGLSWAAILFFLIVVSGFTLLTDSERFGLTSCYFLLASAFALPVAFARHSTLKQRLSKLPKTASISILVVVLLAAGFSAVTYLVTPVKFI